MTHGDQRFAIRTPPGGGASDDIRLDIAGLNIGPALGLFPSAPPVDGVLGANLALNLAADSLSLRGGVSVAELLSGEYRTNANRAGNLLRSQWYVCPVCGVGKDMFEKE